MNTISKKKLLVIGNDKIGRRFLHKLEKTGMDLSNFILVLDSSSNISRILKLLINNKLPFMCLSKMSFAEIIRKNYPKANYNYTIHSNEDLYNILKIDNYSEVFLFRAGLIIDKKSLSLGVKFLNLHCASIPKYGGLCSIYKALKDKSFFQKACLHIVTNKIDDPSVIVDTEPYSLNPNLSYSQNEEIAYSAGITLLTRFLPNVE